MLNMKLIIERIEQGKNRNMSAIINDLIKDHQVKHDKMISNYKRYKASNAPDGVPIFSRKFDDANKVNRKNNNAFDADIIDVKMGYMVGNPIIYSLDKEEYTENEVFDETGYNTDYQVIDDFNKRNNVEDMDAESLKMAAACGYGARLLYVNKEALSAAMSVNPWECIFIRDGSLNEAQYAMRYYPITVNGKEQIFVEWYDDRMISYFLSEGEVDQSKINKDRDFKPYKRNGKYEEPHLFEGVPLIQFPNNEENQGDCDKVYSLIDAYDAALSDVSSELEQFRLAYMAFYGMAPDDKTMDKAKTTGAFGMPDGTKIEFITKNLNDDVIEHLLDRLEKNIYKFAKSVNFSDEDFAGQQSGIAMKYKMFGLESKCVISERKFTAALRTQYKILSSFWKIKGNEVDAMKMQFIWTRNFPLNLLDEADTTMKLKGMISEQTRLGLLSFVDDPDKEIKQMEAENEGMVDVSQPPIDEFGNPIEGENVIGF